MVIVALLIACIPPAATGNELPGDIRTLVDNKNRASQRINRIFIRELEALKVVYVKKGDLRNANIIASLISEAEAQLELLDTSDLKTRVFLDGQWTVKTDKDVDWGKRRFAGHELIVGAKRFKWSVEENGVVFIDWGKQGWERLTIDPGVPDQVQGVNRWGERFTYTRVK